MGSVIRQSVVLAATADELFETYIDPKKHATVTGSAVTISDKPGSKFSAFFGAITGTTLAVVPKRVIVQSWRSTNFGLDDPNSTLVLTFVPQGKKGKIELIQMDVPKVDFEGVKKGWELYYWTPWRRYLEKVAQGSGPLGHVRK